VPTFLLAWKLSGRLNLAIAATVAMLIGGMILGPDLDTDSVQTSRWSIFGFLWFPYRKFFAHRSRFTHGLIFGALFRVVYFAGVVTLVGFGCVFIATTIQNQTPPKFLEIAESWKGIRNFLNETIGENAITWSFCGMWFGAASHTITDIAASFITTGRRGKIL
jgi:uncharacterized metal-binding protein